MTGLYWLIALIIVAAIGLYARSWYYHASDMPNIMIASYAYQTLEYMEYHAKREGEDPERYEIHKNGILVPYMKNRKLDWRQRNDIISYMKQVNWVYEINVQGTKYYVLSRVGGREIETADGLRGAVKEAAQSLHDEGISSDQARATAAAVIAAALRVDALSAPPESRNSAEASASETEEAVRTRDPEKVDRKITRIKDLLQITTYALPFAREILRILGSL